MTDRERVVKTLDTQIAVAKEIRSDFVRLIVDEAKTILELLKLQEPTRKVNENGQILSCGNCGAWFIVQKQKYCHECGQAVKWDD